jgi:histidine triad (HIT) family protein
MTEQKNATSPRSPLTSKPHCLFCKIIAGHIPSKPVFENDYCFVIRDISPQAQSHFLVLPKEHFDSLEDLYSNLRSPGFSDEWMARLTSAAMHVVKSEGLLPQGFRWVINTNAYGGQTVFHLHLHVLGGEPLSGGFGAG